MQPEDDQKGVKIENAQEVKVRHQATIDAFPDHIAVVDHNGVIIAVNKKWREFAQQNCLEWEDFCIGRNYLQVCDQSFSGNDSFECGLEQDALSVAQGIRDILNGQKEVFYLEYPCHSPEEKRWFLMRASLLQDSERKNILIAHINITKRKLAEEELKESESRYRTLIENLNDALFVVDEAGSIRDVNTEACRRYGYSRKEFAGVNIRELDREFEHSELYERLLEQGSLNLETTHLGRDGTRIPTDLSIRLVKYEGEDCALSLARDISAKKEAERLKEDIERIARHDLKTPLNGIIGFPQVLLMDDNLNQEQREYLGYIQDSGYRMLSMIDMTLSLYKMEQGTYECQSERVDILSILQRVEREIFSEFKDSGLSLQVITEYDVDTSCYAWGEEMLCYSVISNLIRNAFQASPNDGAISVSLSSGTEYHYITIHNNGVVPEDVRPVFGEKYATSGKKKGTGLGVYSARLMTQAMGGSFTWSSSTREGTSVTISLPRGDV